MKIKFFSIFVLISQLCLGQLNAEFIAMKPLYVRPVTFNYTGSMQTWTVPSEVFSILIEAVGAQGGNNGGYIGGKGGKVNAILKVTPGDVLYIVVGGQSTTMNAAYGFGGSGGALVNFATRFGRAGGGLTGIFSNATVSQANALIVAAGGGGATTYPTTGGSAGPSTYSAGGGLTGFDGYSGHNYSYGTTWGRAATQTAGGARGIPSDTNYILPTAGAALQGGTGGSSNAATSSGWTAGGGGGGGYYGGGGGSAGGNAQGSGGGGSSYAISSAINVLHTANFRSGHGYLKINY